jgi:hypothetical protein
MPIKLTLHRIPGRQPTDQSVLAHRSDVPVQTEYWLPLSPSTRLLQHTAGEQSRRCPMLRELESSNRSRILHILFIVRLDLVMHSRWNVPSHLKPVGICLGQ